MQKYFNKQIKFNLVVSLTMSLTVSLLLIGSTPVLAARQLPTDHPDHFAKLGRIEAEPLDATKVIESGADVEEASAVYQATILLARPDGATCSGGLISSDLILTAAHCVYDVDYIDVFEDPNPNQNVRYQLQKGIMRSQRVAKSQILTHESGGKRRRKDVDLAMVRLNVPLNNRVFAYLPTAQNKRELDRTNGQILVAGWGRLRPNGHAGLAKALLDYSIDLNHVLEVERGDGMRTEHYGIIYHETGGRMICPGDSGGPAYLASSFDPQQLVLVGIHSAGVACLDTVHAYNKIGYATYLPNYIQWIRATAKNLRGSLNI